MSPSKSPGFSRRERQIMDIIHEMGSATANEVRDGMDDPPSYSAVRSLLSILEKKGHLKHRQDGARYVFSATVPKTRARKSALRSLVRTFFDGSPAQAAEALLDMQAPNMSDEELERLAALIDVARKDQD